MHTFTQDVLPILFFLVIIVLWLVLHYRAKMNNQAFRAQDLQQLQQLQQTSQQLTERVKVLEKILDAKAPDWRREQKL
jgi:phage shock protein B